MSKSGFKFEEGIVGSGPAVYIENGSSVAVGLNASGSFVIARENSDGASTASLPQVEIDSTENIALTPTDTVDITQGHLRIVGTGAYIVLPPSSATVPRQGYIAFDSSGTVPSIHFAGSENTFIGSSAGNFPAVSGGANTGVGDGALGTITTGDFNTVVGVGAFLALTTASSNVGIGYNVAALVASGGNNVIIGADALINSTSCNNTVAIGQNALDGVGTSSGNIAIGTGAGSSFGSTESNNIVIGSSGSIGDSARIRIGTSGFHTGCQIAGIASGTLLGSPHQPVMVSSNGGLGTLAAALDGQVLIGVTSGSPAWATLTPGPNISISNGANSITISSEPGSTVDAATSGNTPTPIITEAVSDSSMITISVVISAHNDTYSNVYGANIIFTAYRPAGGNVTLAGSPIVNANNTSTVDVSVTVDTGAETVSLNVIGNVGENWHWEAIYEVQSL